MCSEGQLYSKVNKKCVAGTIPNCNVMDSIYYACKEYGVGYWIDGESCKVTCPAGELLNKFTNVCTAEKIAGCLTHGSPYYECKGCDAGYVLSSDKTICFFKCSLTQLWNKVSNVCTTAKIDNCQTHDSTYFECRTCVEGYTASGDKTSCIVLCPAGELLKKSTSQCTSERIGNCEIHNVIYYE